MKIQPIISKEKNSKKTKQIKKNKKTTKKRKEKTDSMKKFEKKTGKKAIWRGRITKGFKKWKKKKEEIKKEENKTSKKIKPIKIPEKKKETDELDFTQPSKKEKRTKEEYITLKESPEANKLRKEEKEWKKGPKPSKKVPPDPEYALKPTPEELRLMRRFRGERKGQEVIKPTEEEVELMEELTDNESEEEVEKELVKEKVKKKIYPRTLTGISGIDELTNGGLPKNKSIAVVGGPGTGKSIFLMQFLINGALKKEPGIYITFEEEENELKKNFTSFNFNIKELEETGLLKIVNYSPMKIKRFTKNMDVTLRELIKKMKAKRIVIDSLSAFTLLFENEGDQREGLFQLFQTLKKLGVTSLLSTESWREPTLTKSGVIEFIADGVIVMYNLKIKNTRVRAIEILKMRGINHEMRIVPFRINEDGINIFTDEEVFREEDEQ